MDTLTIQPLAERARCKCCSKLIPAGAEAVVRTADRTRDEWQRGSAIYGSVTRRKVYAVHVECAEQYPIMVGRSSFSRVEV